jgi:hypothetical protein
MMIPPALRRVGEEGQSGCSARERASAGVCVYLFVCVYGGEGGGVAAPVRRGKEFRVAHEGMAGGGGRGEGGRGGEGRGGEGRVEG